jgi:CubicO group peptidase (beta-lactamase class C family)
MRRWHSFRTPEHSSPRGLRHRSGGTPNRPPRILIWLAVALSHSAGALLPQSPFTPHAALAQPAPLAGLDAYVSEAMRRWEIPGLALAVVRDGEILHARGYGVTALGGSEPVSEHTRFAIASTTKAMTAAALGILVDEGRLGWDDPVRAHLPAFAVTDPHVSGTLTVRDLLTHRSGVARLDNLWIASPFTRDEILERIRFLPHAEGFRSGYAYNNLMYLVAGEVAGAVAGVSWDGWLATRLFAPLGMSRTTTRTDAVAREGNAADPHARVGGVVTRIPRRDYDALGGAGAVWSTAHDMARWMQLHLNEGRLPDGTPLLTPSTLREIMTPQVVIPVDSVARRLHPTNHFLTYALGWRVQDLHGDRVVQHSGSINYTRTQVTLVPDRGIGIVAMANLSSSNLQLALTHWILDALAGREPEDWSTLYLEVQTRNEAAQLRTDADRDAQRLEGVGPSLPLAGYEGRYADPLFGEIGITLERTQPEGGLVLTYSPEYIGDLEPWHQDLFRLSWRRPGAGATFVRFTLDERGRIRSADIDGFATFRRLGGQEP